MSSLGSGATGNGTTPAMLLNVAVMTRPLASVIVNRVGVVPVQVPPSVMTLKAPPVLGTITVCPRVAPTSSMTDAIVLANTV